MSRNKSSNSHSWAQADFSPYSVLRRPVCIKERREEKIEQKRKIQFGEFSQPLPTGTESWTVTKRKRSSGVRMRSANVSQNCIGDTRTLTPAANEKDTKTVQNATGSHNQVEKDSLTSCKQQKKLFTNGHIEKFLGNSNPMPGIVMRKKKSTLSATPVQRKTSSARSMDERTNANPSAGKCPDNGGPLFKRLLSALIDENQDLDHLCHEKSDLSRNREWEMDFLGSVPDEKLLLKELHLIGIYPKELPGLIEEEDVMDQDIEDPHEVVYSKVSSVQSASEQPLLTWGRSRSKCVNYAIPEAKSSIAEENNKNGESIPDSGTKRRKGRRVNDRSRDITRNEPASDLDYPTSLSTNTCHDTKSEKVTQSSPKASFQEVKPASPPCSTEQLTIKDNSHEGHDIIGFGGPPSNLSFLLDLDDDFLLDDDADVNIQCLDIPMDDISTFNFDFLN